MPLDSPLPVCLLVHANLQYAEIPTSEIDNIVEKSYLPTLELFLNNDHAKMVMDFSGVTLEILKEKYPEVIVKIRELISKGNVEILGSSYANPMLPLIPLDHAKKQLDFFDQIYEELFGDLGVNPIGFFPQEYFIDASTVQLLSERGYQWVPVHSTHLINSRKGRLNFALTPPLISQDVEKDYLLYKDIVYPFKINGAMGSQIYGFGSYDKFVIERLCQLYEGKIGWDEYRKILFDLVSSDKEQIPFIFLGPSDMEFIGHFSFEGHQPINPKWLEDYCLRISKDPELRFCTPSEYLGENTIKDSIYLKCGGDHPMLDPWTRDPDNVRLDKLSADASIRIRQVEDQLNILEKFGFDVSKSIDTLKVAWKLLLLSENADGRGWNPIPERRLFCFNNLILSQRKVEEAWNMGLSQKQANIASGVYPQAFGLHSLKQKDGD